MNLTSANRTGIFAQIILNIFKMKKAKLLILTILAATVWGGCDKGPQSISVLGVKLDSYQVSITEGDKATLTATVLPENASNKNVSWTSSDEKVATVSASGEVTAVAPGKSAITVTTEDGAKTTKCEVTVNKRIYPVESVSLDKTSLELTEGDKATLTATVLPENASNKNVSWTSSNEKVATVTAAGEVTAVALGKAAITVTTEDGAKTAKCEVTVNKRIYPVESVSLDKTSLELTEGDKATLTATVLPENASNKNVAWSSSDEKVATVSASGEVTAVAPGKAAITVTTEDGAKTAKCEVTVNKKIYPVESVSLDKTSLELTEGDKATLTATVLPENASNKNVSWTSSDEKVATVSASGEVTAVAPGKSAITVTTEDGAKTAKCEVTVKARIIPVTGIRLNKKSLLMMPGYKAELTVTITPSNATNKNITWNSSDASIVAVNNGELEANAEGTATITVTTEDGGKTATCEVTVSSDITKFVEASYSGGSMSIINGKILSGSRINFSVYNNLPDREITVKTAQMIDGVTGAKGSVMSVPNGIIKAGNSAGWSFTVGVSGIYSPIVEFVYTCDGKEYVVSAQYND